MFVNNSSTVNFNAPSGTQTVTTGLGTNAFYNFTHTGASTLQFAAPGATYPVFNYSREITLNNSQVAAAQANFPVLINVTDAGLEPHVLQTNANDILFTDSSGNKLSHEIESYNSSTGHLIAWVQVPALSALSNTILYMYYGNSSCPSQQNVTGTWSNGYVGVWHLGNGSGLSLLDSLGVNNLINNGVNSATGIAGYAGQFTGSGYMSLASPTGLPSGSGARTMETWFKCTTSSPSGYLGGFG